MTRETDLEVVVREVKGTCPVYDRGDRFTIFEGFKLKTEITLCTHSLTSILPYYIPLSRGVSPEELGLGKEDKAYVQCLDPCDYTGGGTVIFEITRNEKDS